MGNRSKSYQCHKSKCRCHEKDLRHCGNCGKLFKFNQKKLKQSCDNCIKLSHELSLFKCIRCGECCLTEPCSKILKNKENYDKNNFHNCSYLIWNNYIAICLIYEKKKCILNTQCSFSKRKERILNDLLIFKEFK